MSVWYESEVQITSKNRKDLIKFFKLNIGLRKKEGKIFSKGFYLNDYPELQIKDENIKIIKENNGINDDYKMEFKISEIALNKINWDERKNFIQSLKKNNCDAYISQFHDNSPSGNELSNQFKLGKNFKKYKSYIELSSKSRENILNFMKENFAYHNYTRDFKRDIYMKNFDNLKILDKNIWSSNDNEEHKWVFEIVNNNFESKIDWNNKEKFIQLDLALKNNDCDIHITQYADNEFYNEYQFGKSFKAVKENKKQVNYER